MDYKIEKVFFEEVKEDIIKLDRKNYKLKIKRKWYERYSTGRGKCIVLRNEKNKIIAYLLYSNITIQCLDILKLGLLTGDYNLSPSCYVKDSNQIYLASIVVKEKYRKQGLAKKLYEEFLNDNKGKAFITHFGNNLKYSSFVTGLERKGVKESQYDTFYGMVSDLIKK